jgi:predicted flap endonuclease-1-like 5' DNA nuclease
MATKTKTNKATPKANKTANVAKKINADLINASVAAIDTTVKNGEKWQKLASKLFKKSETVRTQQVNMIFDTAEAVKGQMVTGTKRMKNLVGIEVDITEKVKCKVMNNPVTKKVMEVAEDVSEKVQKNPMVQRAEKKSAEYKSMGKAKFNEVKGDVLNKATKIINKAEAKLEEIKADAQKTSSEVKAEGAKKVKAVKKTTKAKVTKTMTAAETKATVTKAKAKTKATEIKKEATKKVADIKTKGATKVKEVKAEVKKAVKTVAKDDLKLIYGVGPKAETAFNAKGINTYADLKNLDNKAIEDILENAGVTVPNLNAADWRKQAEVAVEGGEEALKTWVERYRTA